VFAPPKSSEVSHKDQKQDVRDVAPTSSDIAASDPQVIVPAKSTKPQTQIAALSQSVDEISTLVKALLARDSLATVTRLTEVHATPVNIEQEADREAVMEKLAKRSAAVLGWESASNSVQISVGVLASLPDRPD
jgi:hypothetical protein